jgi:hypothetical protein
MTNPEEINVNAQTQIGFANGQNVSSVMKRRQSSTTHSQKGIHEL